MALRWLGCVLGYAFLIVATPILVDVLLRGVWCWPEPAVGALTAFTVVAWVFFSAPKGKPVAAAFALCLGAWLSYQVFDLHWYPECHALAYQRVYWPWPLTVSAGVLAWLGGFWLWRTR